MNQRKAIKDYLLQGYALTSMEAFNMFGATRLSAIIFDLKKQGMDIESRRIPVRTRFEKDVYVAEYRLRKEEN